VINGGLSKANGALPVPPPTGNRERNDDKEKREEATGTSAVRKPRLPSIIVTGRKVNYRDHSHPSLTTLSEPFVAFVVPLLPIETTDLRRVPRSDHPRLAGDMKLLGLPMGGERPDSITRGSLPDPPGSSRPVRGSLMSQFLPTMSEMAESFAPFFASNTEFLAPGSFVPSLLPVVRRCDCIGGHDHSGAQTQPFTTQRSPLRSTSFGIL
jgi:hypothetical protein